MVLLGLTTLFAPIMGLSQGLVNTNHLFDGFSSNAVMSIIAGARPLTVVVAALASPITSLNPTIGAGMVAGLVEAWQRKPTVEDCEGVAEITGFAEMRRNNFTRVLLVAVFATLGSAIGAWIGAAWVVKLL